MGKDYVDLRFYQNTLDGMGFANKVGVNFGDIIKLKHEQLGDVKKTMETMGIRYNAEFSIVKDP